ncbi:MAG TPA: amidohydrolase family protein, partial [Vicinamibacteria bacterium]|nr:amidohydrolase family protein [Vicinamibacteria bacterium]
DLEGAMCQTHSRRQFVCHAGAAIGATAGVATLGGAEIPRAPAPRVFDAHLHAPAEKGELWQWHTVTRNFDEFVAYLDQTGVERGIVNSQRCQQDGGKPADFVAGNREIARFVEKHKGRFLGACAVNPQYLDEALKEVEYCRRQLGFVWVGELCNYMGPYQYTIKEFELLVGEVVRLGMVLDVHTEHDEIDYIVKKFPQATIVFPHFGDEREYDHIFKRIDLVAKHPNCYLDTSGYGHDRMGMLEYAVKTIGPDRVLFGSDFSINDPATVLARIHHAFLSEEQKAKVLARNLEALLAKFPA